MSVKIEYSDYVESRPPAESVDGSELLAVSKDGEAVQLTAAQIASLSPGVSDGDKGDVTVSGFGTVWTVDPDFVQSVVDTSGTSVVLDFEDTLKGSFTGSVTFAVPRTVTRANESRAIEYDFMFEVTDVAATLDFGSDTRSPDARFLDGVFTPQDVGLYKVKGTRYGPGGLWLLDFNGVYSVGDAPPDPPDPGDSWVIGSGIWNDTAIWKDTGIWRDSP